MSDKTRWPGCEHGLPKDQCDLCRPAPSEWAASAGSEDVFDETLEFVLAEIDNLPDDWDNYAGLWQAGYNQCRNRVAALLANYRKRNPPNAKLTP